MLRVLSTVLIPILLFGCNGSKTFFNQEANKMPGDEAFLKGKVKKIVFPGNDTDKVMYVDFDRSGNITETNILVSLFGEIITNDSILIRNEYYPDNHIKRRILLNTETSYIYSVDTVVQTNEREFKMFRTVDRFDSSAKYFILRYDDNGYLKRKEIQKKKEIISSEDYENNASGFPVKVTGWVAYEPRNTETKIYLSKWNTPDSILYGRGTVKALYHKFDQDGNIIERKLRYSFTIGTEYIDKLAYELDDRGNWITRTSIRDNLPKIEKRTITYWD